MMKYNSAKLEDPPEFARIDNKSYTTWKLADGNTMVGILVQDWGEHFNVVRPDGTTCRVPRSKCSPATPENILQAVANFNRNFKGTPA